MKISEIDKNLKVSAAFDREELSWVNILDSSARLFGLLYDEKAQCFCRMPPCAAAEVSAGVRELNMHTAGGRVRLRTNSATVAIYAIQDSRSGIMPHMAFLGSSGFDAYIYEDGHYIFAGSFIPPIDRAEAYSAAISFPSRSDRDISINFPLYDKVKALYIGVEKQSYIHAPQAYVNTAPAVFYGSSITQGGCASRPGTAYEAVISRSLNMDYINLGFSGSALGERKMAEYLASLEASVFVLDYDHNAPSAEHLRQTHWNLYSAIRAKQPQTPIILISRPDCPYKPEEIDFVSDTRQVIAETYKKALSLGDRNIAFIDGAEFFKLHGLSDCTVDGKHPNDLGFYCMAKIIGEQIKNLCRI